jgi:uncharacterized coiled-coil protein SlyX
MMGQRYLGNLAHKEIHDLDNEKTNCEIDKIIAVKNDVPFNWLSRANDKGYDNCAYCLGRSTRQLRQKAAPTELRKFQYAIAQSLLAIFSPNCSATLSFARVRTFFDRIPSRENPSSALSRLQSQNEPKKKNDYMNTPTRPFTNSTNRSPFRSALLLILFVLAGVALSTIAQAVTPAPDGGYGSGNTAEGTNALFSLTSGVWNTAIGNQTLYHDTTGNQNTAEGYRALFSNTIGRQNTANGATALFSNTTGNSSTATGFQALYSNTDGASNTADGFQTLSKNTFGSGNTSTGCQALYFNNADGNVADGFQALFRNTFGGQNTAGGYLTLRNNTTGSYNTANGGGALYSNTDGNFNTAIGASALQNNSTGDNNIALGDHAGQFLTTGNLNIDIGNFGVAGEWQTIRIGDQDYQHRTFVAGINGVAVAGSAVVVNGSGQLGVAGSSERFKNEIKPMDKASEAVLALKPVTFRYKKNIDPQGTPQFGLVAEEVEKVNPDLVARDDQGKVYTVRYEAVNAMLLNEFLKQHRKVEQQEATITQLKSSVARQETRVAQQQEEIKALTATLKEQASQIQKVSAQVALSKSSSQTVFTSQ